MVSRQPRARRATSYACTLIESMWCFSSPRWLVEECCVDHDNMADLWQNARDLGGIGWDLDGSLRDGVWITTTRAIAAECMRSLGWARGNAYNSETTTFFQRSTRL